MFFLSPFKAGLSKYGKIWILLIVIIDDLLKISQVNGVLSILMRPLYRQNPKGLDDFFTVRLLVGHIGCLIFKNVE